MDLAREVFIEVGHMLKKRRQADLLHDFGCYLTDELREDDDPTYSDPNLRRKLAENRHLGEAKLNSVFDKFVQLQQCEQPGLNETMQNDKSMKRCSSDTSGSDHITKRSRVDSDSASDSESGKSSDYEVVSLSSDSDEPNQTESTPQVNEPQSSPVSSTASDSTGESCTIVPDHQLVSHQSNPSPIDRTGAISGVDLAEPVIHLSDDDDDVHISPDSCAIVPVSAPSPNPIPRKSPIILTSVLNDLPRFRPFRPGFQPRIANVYPVVQETRSLTVTQRCNVGPSGVQTAVYRQEAMTSRFMCPSFANPSGNSLLSSTVCISSTRSLSAEPPFRPGMFYPFTRPTQSYQHRTTTSIVTTDTNNTGNSNRRNSNMTSSQVDCSDPIVLD
ncbi:unnamed protein product [Echinostoma caproni]|uniref:LisH domain-containing protein n=1 Tax=Echinostoma caproni TaxID=27848 RepID=A0A183AGP0_9TREM|nr:unnamed protein product [Echinostoma caproni]